MTLSHQIEAEVNSFSSPTVVDDSMGLEAYQLNGEFFSALMAAFVTHTQTHTNTHTHTHSVDGQPRTTLFLSLRGRTITGLGAFALAGRGAPCRSDDIAPQTGAGRSGFAGVGKISEILRNPQCIKRPSSPRTGSGQSG